MPTPGSPSPLDERILVQISALGDTQGRMEGALAGLSNKQDGLFDAIEKVRFDLRGIEAMIYGEGGGNLGGFARQSSGGFHRQSSKPFPAETQPLRRFSTGDCPQLEAQPDVQGAHEQTSTRISVYEPEVTTPVQNGRSSGSLQDDFRRTERRFVTNQYQMIHSSTSIGLGGGTLLGAQNRASGSQRDFVPQMTENSMGKRDTAQRGKTDDLIAPLLPPLWPQLAIREGLEGEVFAGLGPASMGTRAVKAGRMPSLQSAESLGEDVGEKKVSSFWSFMCIDPNGTFLLVYNMVSLFLLFYDLTSIPFILAWEIPTVNRDIVGVMTLFTAAFWLVDIFVNFFIGFYKNGELHMTPGAIACHYIRGWFISDLVVVGCDWFSTILSFTPQDSESAGGNGFKLLRFAKLGRFIRILAMLRMLRFMRILEDFMERNFSEMHRLGLKIFSYLAVLFWWNHLICCAWYLVGNTTKQSAPSGRTWVSVMEEEMEEGHDMLYQYITSFHWAAAQITLGAMDVNAINTYERVFNVLCLMTGLILGSMLISSLSASLVDFQMQRKEHNEKMRLLRQYLRENFVAKRVAVIILKQATERMKEREPLTPQDVVVLELLSHNLRMQLHFEVVRSSLIKHPLFRLWTNMDMHTAQQVCMHTTASKFLRPKDQLFLGGSPATHAYLLMTGSLKYIQQPDSAPVEDFTEEEVTEGTWLAEAALWLMWVHVGTAEAITSSQVLTLAEEGLIKILRRNLVLYRVTMEYARQFHRRVAASAPPDADYPTDVSCQLVDYGEIVFSMSAEVQLVVGADALRHLEAMTNNFRLNMNGVEDLRKEVQNGKSTIMVKGDGAVQRVVSVVALRIQSDDSQIFVQIGKWEDNKIVPTFQLPGAKQERGELPREAIERILAAKLSQLSDLVGINRLQRELSSKLSKEYGIHTTYIKTICWSKPIATQAIRDRVPKLHHIPAPMGQSGSCLSARSLNLQHTPSTYASRSRIMKENMQSQFQQVSNLIPSSPANSNTRANMRANSLKSEEKEVYALGDGKKWAFYAWITEQDYDLLKEMSDNGEQIVSCWLERLDFDPDAMNASKDEPSGPLLSSDENGSLDVGAADADGAVGRQVTCQDEILGMPEAKAADSEPDSQDLQPSTEALLPRPNACRVGR